MRITNALLPDDNEIGISEMSITYTRNADGVSDRDDVQFLTIEMRNGGTQPDDAFFNIKTGECGWSVDSADDIKNVLEDFINRFNSTNND